MVIQGMTFGLSPFVFTLGDDMFADFIADIPFLPTTIMMFHLCPVGSEGASYAMFTNVNDCVLEMALALSSACWAIVINITKINNARVDRWSLCIQSVLIMIELDIER